MMKKGIGTFVVVVAYKSLLLIPRFFSFSIYFTGIPRLVLLHLFGLACFIVLNGEDFIDKCECVKNSVAKWKPPGMWKESKFTKNVQTNNQKSL
jgi:hypothetical protein